MRTRICAASVALALVVITLAGCKSVPDEAKAVLATAALAAKERAAAFAVIRPRLVAKEAKDRAGLQKYMQAHGNGLNAQADALDKLNAAVAAGGSLSQPTRSALKAEADTAKMRADLFRAVTPKIASNPEVDLWREAHQAALDSQAAALVKLAALLAKEKKPAPAPTIEKSAASPAAIQKYAAENGITPQIAKEAGVSLEAYVLDYAQSHGPALPKEN